MIKASLEILQPINDQSFLMRKFDKSAFDAPYHFHEEYELTYILNGSGKRYVGNHMEAFKAGDLILLGPNLPHCWKLNKEEKQQEAGAIVIQFSPLFLGQEFFNKAELQHIKNLLQKSACGASFNANQYHNIKTHIHEKHSFLQLSFEVIIVKSDLPRNI